LSFLKEYKIYICISKEHIFFTKV